MILSAMIFAGLTLIIGLALGFLLGQARARMVYEEKLREAETARASLVSQADELREELRSASSRQPSAVGPNPPEEARG